MQETKDGRWEVQTCRGVSQALLELRKIHLGGVHTLGCHLSGRRFVLPQNNDHMGAHSQGQQQSHNVTTQNVLMSHEYILTFDIVRRLGL